MSATAPYVAPWATDFRRYSTQIVDMPTIGINSCQLFVPDGQWWRIVFVNIGWATFAAVANRVAVLQVVPKGGGVGLIEPAPAAQLASVSATYLYAPGITSFTNLTDPNNNAQVLAIPDLIWAPGTKIQWIVNNAQAGDNFTSPHTLAYELYVPDPAGGLVPLPTPLPL